MKTPSPAKTRKPKAAAPAAPTLAPAADEPLTFDDEGIKRVADIIRNARATWFALLGALVFASVTLASVKDISFFVNTVETKLPIVGISVPVVSFFWAGSLLTAALYAYFHLYLELLWQALGDFPARDKSGAPLADRIEPWIVADTALRFRDWLRGDTGDKSASRRRAMPWISGFVSLGLVWVFGLAVIFWFWWRSMPAHDLILTSFIGIVTAFTLWVFGRSLIECISQLSNRELKWRWKLLFTASLVSVAGLTVVRTWIDPWAQLPRTELTDGPLCSDPRFDHRDVSYPERFSCWVQFAYSWDILRPARADLHGEVFATKPNDWISLDDAEVQFRSSWCRELGKEKCPNPLALSIRQFHEPEENAYQQAWVEQRDRLVRSFERPRMLAADLRGANLAVAQLEGALLSFAKIDGANIEGAKLQEAGLTGAQLVGANLFLARLEGARLVDANLERSNLAFANFDGVDLSSARLFGTEEHRLDLNDTDLARSDWRAAALRFADLDTVDLRELKNFDLSFGDGSVKLPAGAIMPARWCKSVLTDDQFFGRWRGWVEGTLGSRSDRMFNFFPAIPPSEPCPEYRTKYLPPMK